MVLKCGKTYQVLHHWDLACIALKFRPFRRPKKGSSRHAQALQELDQCRAQANDLRSAQEEQLVQITQISKEFRLLSTLSLVNTHAYLCIRELLTHVLGIETVSWPFVMLMLRFTFTGARRIQRRDYPNAWSARRMRGRDVPAR
jgi:hypothetical protein